VFVRISTVVRSIVGLTLVLGLAAPAAAQGTSGVLVGAGLSFLNLADDTGTGFFVDVAKNFRSMGNLDIGAVGDLGWHSFDGANVSSFQGGARVTGSANPKYQPFGQFLFGLTHVNLDGCVDEGCSDTGFTINFGGGIDIRLNDKLNFRGQLDIPISFFDEDTLGTETGFRYSFGISLPLGR
jgi:hypothetical protein